MGHESTRLRVDCDVANSMGTLQVRPSDKKEKQLRYHEGIVQEGRRATA